MGRFHQYFALKTNGTICMPVVENPTNFVGEETEHPPVDLTSCPTLLGLGDAPVDRNDRKIQMLSPWL